MIQLLDDIGIRQLRLTPVRELFSRDHEFYQRLRKLVGNGFRLDLVVRIH